MKSEARSLLASITTVLAALPWGGILVNVLTLLGLAGSAVATQVTGWLSPLLFCASILLLGRSFYVIYVRKTSSRLTTIVAWCSLTFMISFWSWYVLSGRLANEHEPVAATNEEAKNDEKPLVVSPQTITLHVPEMKMRGGYEGAELTGMTGPNRVQEALVGLPGVEAVTVDLDSELLEVRFDANKMTPATLLQTVDKLGFQGKIKGGR